MGFYTENFLPPTELTDKVKVSSVDAISNYLENKLVEGENITITKVTDISGEETLVIRANASINSQFDITSWVLDENGVDYKFVVDHQLNTLYPTVEVRQNDVIVFCRVVVIDSNKIKLQVSMDPDLRFIGKVNVIKI